MISALFILATQATNTPPTIKLTLPSKPVSANSKVQASLSVQFAAGLHGYQNPPSDEFTIPVTVKLAAGGAKLISVKYPKGTDMKMGGSDKPQKVYAGTISIPIVLKAPNKSSQVVVLFSYQQCNESSCFPPGTVTAKALLTVK